MDPCDIRGVLIMDSRGEGIQQELDDLGLKTQVSFYPGGGMVVSSLNALPLIASYKPDIVTIAASICDVTMKIRYSSNDRFGIKYRAIEEATTHFEEQLYRSHFNISTDFPNMKVNYATLIGVDLTDYNFKGLKHMSTVERNKYISQKVRHQDQDQLDMYVKTFNNIIAKLNRTRNVPTPWASNIIHKWYSGKPRTSYNLLTDGCHFSQKVKTEWAKKLLQSYKKI